MSETAVRSRKTLHAYVSDDAHEQWHNFAAENGVSLSALLDSLGQEINDPEHKDQDMGSRLRSVVMHARQTDARRRRRSGRAA